MKHNNQGVATRVASILLAGALPLAAQAQIANDEWKMGATLYLWLPSLSGTTYFASPGGGSSGPSIDVDADKLIDALQMAFMGSIEGKKGAYGFLSDLAYIDVDGAKSSTRDFTLGGQSLPAGLTADLKLTLKASVWTTVGSYTLQSTPDHMVDLLGGVRMLDIKPTLDWKFGGNVGGVQLPGLSGSQALGQTNWDGVIGVKGKVNFGSDRKWFSPYYLDVGAGESKSTWQAAVGLGYQYGWGNVTASWRYLDYRFKSDSPVQSLTLSGPAISATWQW